MDLLSVEVRGFMQTEFVKPDKIPTVDEWICTGHWIEGTARTGGNVSFTIDVKRKLSGKTKPAEGVLLTD